MKHTLVCLAVVLTLCGCRSARRSQVADSLGCTTGSRSIDVGPYTVHYGSDGQSDLLLVAKGNQNLYSVMGTNSWTAVYDPSGFAFVDFSDENGDTMADRVTINLRDATGKDTLSFIDTNANGAWDHRVDIKAKSVSDWIDGHWVDRKPK